MDAALEAGAEDVVLDEDVFVVTCDPKLFAQVANHFDKVALTFEEGDLTMVPENTIKISGEDAEKVLRLIDRLEDLDDVQKVYANFDIDESELERIL